MSISASLTVNHNIEALLSVLCSEKKTVKYAKHDNSIIYAKAVALLMASNKMQQCHYFKQRCLACMTTF